MEIDGGIDSIGRFLLEQNSRRAQIEFRDLLHNYTSELFLNTIENSELRTRSSWLTFSIVTHVHTIVCMGDR